MANTELAMACYAHAPARSLFGQDEFVRWLLIVGMAACAPAEPPALVMTANPIALGATAHGRLDGLSAVTVEPAGIVSVAETDGGFDLVALAEGTTRLTATRDDGEEAARVVVVATIDDVIVTPALHGVACTAPALFATGMRASIPVELRGDGQILHGDIVPPVDVTGATIDADTSADGTLELRMPDVTGPVSLTAAGGSIGELRAFAPSEVTALEVTAGATTVHPLMTVDLAIDLQVDGRAACGDALSRTVTIETPQTCELADSSTSVTSAGLADVGVRGVRAGQCRIRVELGGTALVATQSLTVTM
jgi:hypothetical protein